MITHLFVATGQRWRGEQLLLFSLAKIGRLNSKTSTRRPSPDVVIDKNTGLEICRRGENLLCPSAATVASWLA